MATRHRAQHVQPEARRRAERARGLFYFRRVVPALSPAAAEHRCRGGSAATAGRQQGPGAGASEPPAPLLAPSSSVRVRVRGEVLAKAISEDAAPLLLSFPGALPSIGNAFTEI